MKQSSVEWLAEQLYPAIKLNSKIINELVEQAKEMERKQIIDAFDSTRILFAEEYYNETYGSKGSDGHELDDDIPPTSQYFPTSSQTERMYSEEDLREALFSALNIDRTTCCTRRTTDSIVRESIQSLKTYGSKGSEIKQ